MAFMIDLADYLQLEVDKERSIRKVAKQIGISKTTVENIVKRRLKKFPAIGTLEKIADRYDLTLPVVVRMTGAMMGNDDRYVQLAHEMEARPWITERFDELASMSKEDFNETMDYYAFRKNRGPLPPRQSDDQSNP